MSGRTWFNPESGASEVIAVHLLTLHGNRCGQSAATPAGGTSTSSRTDVTCRACLDASGTRAPEHEDLYPGAGAGNCHPPGVA